MDMLFTKDELASSLMFKSKGKSTKPPLDKERVEKMFKLIEEKFKDDQTYQQQWDLKAFITKANQKCRDTSRHVKVELEEPER